MRHTPIDIVNMQFPKAVRGYRSDAVRRFLAEVADDLESVISDRAALLEEVETLKQQLDRFAAMENAIKSAAVTAERNADQTRANAQKEAESILRQAQQKGQEMVADATQEAGRVRQEIDRLLAARDRFVAEYGARLRAELELLEKAASQGIEAQPPSQDTGSDDEQAA